MSYLNKYYSLPSVKNKIYNNSITLNIDYDYYNIYIKRESMTHVISLKEFVNQSDEMHKKMITDYINDFIRNILNNLDEYNKVLLHFFKKQDDFNLKEYISVNVSKITCEKTFQELVFINLDFKGFDYNFMSLELDDYGGVEKYIEKQKIKKKIEDF